MFKELEEYYKVISSLSEHTIKSYESSLESFFDYLKIKTLNDLKKVSTEDVSDWMRHLSKNPNAKNEDTAKSSANARFRVVKAFYNWLIEMGYVDLSPCDAVRRFKEAKNVKTYLTDEEWSSMLLKCKNIKQRLMLAMVLYTGLRRKELVDIKIHDIAGNRLVVHGKGRKERVLVLNSYVLDLIKEYLTTREDNCEYLFVSKKKGFGDYKNGEAHPISEESFRQVVKKAAENAGIEEHRIKKIAPHTLRRTFAVNLAKSYGASSFQIQKALGHESVRTTEIYLSAAGSEIADDVMLQQKPPTAMQETN